MPLDEATKTQSLISAGYDPTQYDLSDEGEVTDKAIKESPPIINKTPNAITPSAEQSSIGGALGRSALASTIPTAGGFGAGALAAEYLPFAHMFPPWSELGAGLIGGIGGSYAASKLQGAVLPDSVNQQLAVDQQLHPTASTIGGFAPAAIAFNPLAGIKNLPSVARSGAKMLGASPNALTAGEVNDLANTLINSGTAAGQNIYEQNQNPDGKPFDYSSLALNTGLASILNTPSGIGKSLGFHSGADIDRVNAAEAQAEQDAIKSKEIPPANPTIWSGDHPDYQTPFQFGQQITPSAETSTVKLPNQQVITPEPENKTINPAANQSAIIDKYTKLQPSYNLDVEKQQADNTKVELEKHVEDLQKTADDVNELVGRRNDALQQLENAKNQLNILNGQPVFDASKGQSGPSTRPIIIPDNPTPATQEIGKQVKPLAVNYTPENTSLKSGAELAQAGKTKYQGESQLEPEQRKPHPYDKLTWEQLPQSFKDKVATLAQKRGISLLEAQKIIDPATGEAKLGSANNAERTATVSNELGRGDTVPHEIGHNFLDDLKNSAIPADQLLHKRALDIAGGDPKVADENLASGMGIEGYDKIVGNKDRFSQWLTDFKNRWKNTLGMKMSDKDITDYLTHRMLTDAPRGMRGEIGGEGLNHYNSLIKSYKEETDPYKKKAIQREMETIKNTNKGMPPTKNQDESELDANERAAAKVPSMKVSEDASAPILDLVHPTSHSDQRAHIVEELTKKGMKESDAEDFAKKLFPEHLDEKYQSKSGLDTNPTFATSAEKELGKDRPFGLTLSKNGTLPKDTLKAKLEKFIPSDELASLKDAGIDKWLADKREVNIGEAKKWVSENGPKVEVRKLGEGSRAPEIQEYNDLTHNWFDTLQPAQKQDYYKFNSVYDNDLSHLSNWRQVDIDKAIRYKELALSDAVIKGDRGDRGDRSHWQSISPKPESEMKGYTEIAVVRPYNEKLTRNQLQEGKSANESAGIKFPSSHSFPPNTLAWVRGHMEITKDGRKVFLIHEVQSDWAQTVAKDEANFQEHVRRGRLQDTELARAGYSDNLTDRKDPLLSHYESLALKAAIEHTRSEGADAIAVPDAETAMMVEGHDRGGYRNYLTDSSTEVGDWVLKDSEGYFHTYPSEQEALKAKDNMFKGQETEVRRATKDDIEDQLVRPTQEKGMRQHYDQSLPNIAKKLTGQEGVRKSFGEHKMAFENAYHGEDDREGQVKVLRKDLIFRNPDGTPKTDVTAKVFPIDKVNARREAGEPFTLTGSKYQSKSGLTPETVNLGNRSDELNEAKKSKSNPLPYSTAPVFRSLLDSIRMKNGKEGGDLADASNRYFVDKDSMRGKYMYPIERSISENKLSPEDLSKVDRTMIAEARSKKFFDEGLTSKQKLLKDTIRESLNQKQKDQIEAKQPINDYDSEGKPIKREAGVDPFYYPFQADQRVIQTLGNENPSNRATVNNLKQDFLDYQKEQGINPEAAQKKMDAIQLSHSPASVLKLKEGGAGNFFKANRIAQGVGLPDSWLPKNKPLNRKLSDYFNRVASDRAFHDNIETNPDVAKSIGLTEDPWGNAIKSDALPIGGEDAKTLLESMRGEAHSEDSSKVKSLNKLATSFMLGPVTNAHIFVSSLANSIGYLKGGEGLAGITHAISGFNEHYQEALKNGYARKDPYKVSDILDNTNTFSERVSALSQTINNLSGRGLVNHTTKGLLQGLGDYIVKQRIGEAKNGNADSTTFLKKLNPDFDSAKDYSPEDQSKMASTLAGLIHGAHDARTMPRWMLHDSAIQPFFSLASWNIAQTNNFMKHVWTPATKGNFTPLIMSTMGAALGGYALKELREGITQKKAPFPWLTDLAASSKGIEGNIPLAAYNAMSLASMSGFGGILSMLGKTGFDIAYKNIPQGASFPLDEVMSSSIQTATHAIGALSNAQNMKEAFPIIARASTDLMRDNIQLARIAHTWTMTLDPKLMPDQLSNMEMAKAKNQYRNFRMAEGQPIDEQTPEESNPYLDLPVKSFRKTTDLQEAAEEIPNLIQRALTKANGNSEILQTELKKLKTNSYQTMPNPESLPMEFMKYVTYLQKTKGDEKATDTIRDYMLHNQLNKVKSEMIPF